MQNDIHRLVKMKLPNGKVLDISDDVLKQISLYTQSSESSNESGGLLIGYTHRVKKCIIIESITKPQKNDMKSRTSFIRKDLIHMQILKRFKTKKSDYLGTWHTHPQDMPSPSFIDIRDWKECLEKESTQNGYILFVIWGRKHFEVWAGDIRTKEISILDEWPSHDDVYIK